MDGYFLAIGELLADVVSTNFCTTLESAEGFRMLPGGSPANVAVTVARLGGKAELVSCIGNDGLGRFLLAALQKGGIGVTNIQVHPERATSMVLVTRSTGTPDFIVYRHADRYISPLEKSVVSGSAVVHTTAFALGGQPARASIIAAMKAAHAAGKTVSVDWNFAPSIWSGISDASDVFESVMKMTPLLKASVDDIERYTGTWLSIEACKSFLERYSTKATCLTCGKDGVWFRGGRGAWQFLPAVPVEEVVDVTGAGDAFWAGFIVRFMEGNDLPQCVENGLEAAAGKIASKGSFWG